MLVRLLEGPVFEPSTVSLMVKAYDAACRRAGIAPGEQHRLAELLARTIIEASIGGDRDPEVMTAKALAAAKMT